MTVRERLRSVWIFLVHERMGYYRPVHVPRRSVVTNADEQLHRLAEERRREIKTALRFLDAQSDVFRRIE